MKTCLSVLLWLRTFVLDYNDMIYFYSCMLCVCIRDNWLRQKVLIQLVGMVTWWNPIQTCPPPQKKKKISSAADQWHKGACVCWTNGEWGLSHQLTTLELNLYLFKDRLNLDILFCFNLLPLYPGNHTQSRPCFKMFRCQQFSAGCHSLTNC